MFGLARVIPGNPARLALGPTATPDQVQALSDRLGLDKPILTQYWEFLRNAANNDFGMSLYTNRPVAVDISQTFPATFELVLVSITIITVFGLLLAASTVLGVDHCSVAASVPPGGLDRTARTDEATLTTHGAFPVCSSRVPAQHIH